VTEEPDEIEERAEEYKESEEQLEEIYNELHPQVLSSFEDEMPKYWGENWKANTTVGKLRTALLHKPGEEFTQVGEETPWPPDESSLAAWRMTEDPDLDELIEHHYNLRDALEREGVDVITRKPDPNDPPYQVKSIYCDDVAHSAVYGHVILRMYDYIRRGEEVPTFKTLAENNIPVVGMVTGKGMVEGGPCGWLDEKHLLIEVHYPRGNTSDPEITEANESGHQQYANIVKQQDPEVDVRMSPGYGSRKGTIHYSMVDRHTSVGKEEWYDPYLVDWMKAEMDWNFIEPPEDLISIDTRGFAKGPDTGVVLEPGKILTTDQYPKATKWFESIGIEVVEVTVDSLVRPRNSGSIHCCVGSLRRDPEPNEPATYA
jgi:N-dimethylarginine dimethylaminohydrolase